MSIEAALVEHLRANSDVMDIVGGTGGAPDRIFPLVIPQKIPQYAARTPCIVYSTAGVERQVGYCGTVGTVERTVAIDLYAQTYVAARELADVVRRALVDFSGSMGGLVLVRAASLVSEFDTQDIEPGLFRVVQSWSFWHRET